MDATRSGERFSAIYRLSGPAAEAESRAREIAVEQTIEFPIDLVTDPRIRDRVVGRVERVQPLDEELAEVEISYAVEVVGGELTQLVNVLFGNISLQPGIRLTRIAPSPSLVRAFGGPRFGRDGLRSLLGVPERPLLCTALKPLGLGPAELAEQAYAFARGGIDVIKDDHGLADQSFAPFRERVLCCLDAVARANAETGGGCRYAPSVTGPDGETRERARAAREAGAGALMVAPGLVGLDALRRLSADDGIGLPILSHPALLGSFVLDPHQGISHGALFGQLNRLAGADAVIFPHAGGRFSFSEDDCRDLLDGTRNEMSGIAPIVPVPAGGMRLDRVQEMVDFYGRDVMLLIGGDLHRHGPDLERSCAEFRGRVER